MPAIEIQQITFITTLDVTTYSILLRKLMVSIHFQGIFNNNIGYDDIGNSDIVLLTNTLMDITEALPKKKKNSSSTE